MHDLAVDQNLESGRRMIFSRAEERGGCTCKVLQRSSKSGSKEVLAKYQVVSSEYVIPGPHRCEGLYNAPGAWPLVPDFPPRYASPKNQVNARTWSKRASPWSIPGGLYDVGVGQVEEMLEEHLGQVLDQKDSGWHS